MTGRRADDHLHREYWEKTDQHRFEDEVSAELRGVKQEVKKLNDRITLLLGALALVAFALPIIAPFVRAALGISQ